ncbi:hypothetical protein [Rhodophyticola porphyridii]|nr:hypothetical protein [Rhodophyticola porphyridii]
MTNTLALWLAAIIIAVFAADFLIFGWDLHLILGELLLRLLDWMAFWR